MTARIELSHASVRAALSTLGDIGAGTKSALIDLQTVTARLQDGGYDDTLEGRVLIRDQLLMELVWLHLMQHLGTPDRLLPTEVSVSDAEALLQVALKDEHFETQAWAALYYKYFVERSQPLQKMSRYGMSYATFNRRVILGYRLLSRQLLAIEAQARQRELAQSGHIPEDMTASTYVSSTRESARTVSMAGASPVPGEYDQSPTAVIGREFVAHPRYSTLIGRSEALESLLGRLHSPAAPHQLIIAITGLGGIGKTALAHKLVNNSLDQRQFHGVVWASAKSEELEGGRIVTIASPPRLTFAALQHLIVKQLGLDHLRGLAPDQLERELRRTLRTNAYLIVVDNLETVDASHDLARNLHGLLGPTQRGITTRALLTSRERLLDVPYVFDYYLSGLDAGASEEFIRSEASDRGAQALQQAPPALLHRIYDTTRGMPLAMKLIVSQFLAGIPIDTEIERLRNTTEEDLYRFLYLELWHKLSLSAQYVLVAAGTFSDAASRTMLQKVSRISDAKFETAITGLVRMSLVDASDHLEAAHRRYDLHPLTRWFVNGPLRSQWEHERE